MHIFIFHLISVRIFTQWKWVYSMWKAFFTPRIAVELPRTPEICVVRSRKQQCVDLTAGFDTRLCNLSEIGRFITPFRHVPFCEQLATCTRNQYSRFIPIDYQKYYQAAETFLF
jgi:hypothetical protein